MTQQTTITLDDRSGSIVRAKLDAGEYANAEEVVRAGLSLLEDRDRRTLALRDALIEGERSGPPEDFDFEAYIGRKKHGAVAAE